MSRTVRVVEGQVVRGASYLYRSAEAAMRASRRVTTNPGVISYEVFGGETVFAARGDYWLGRDGERGVYEYGIGGKLLDVVELELGVCS